MNVKVTSPIDARTILVGLVNEYGQGIVREPRRLEGLLRDFCPSSRREIAALTAALKEPVIQDLLTLRNQIPPSMLVARLARQLHDRLGLTESLAAWAVESWAVALGIMPESAIPARSSVPNIQTELPDTASTGDTTLPPPPSTPIGSSMELHGPSIPNSSNQLQQLLIQANKALQWAKGAAAAKESLSFSEEALRLATTACRLFSTPPAAETIAVQAKALLVRAAWQCASESQSAGHLAQSQEYLGRLLKMQPHRADALARQAEIEHTRQELLKQAEMYWSACKLPKAISRLEKSLVAFPGDQEIVERLAAR